MTNTNDNSKSVHGIDDSDSATTSNEQGRRKQSSESNHDEQPNDDASRPVLPSLNVSRNNRVPPHELIHPSNVVPQFYHPLDAVSIFQQLPPPSSPFIIPNICGTTATTPLNRESLIRILDCALAICDEFLVDHDESCNHHQ